VHISFDIRETQSIRVLTVTISGSVILR